MFELFVETGFGIETVTRLQAEGVTSKSERPLGAAGADIGLRVEGMAGLLRYLTAIAPEVLRAAA